MPNFSVERVALHLVDRKNYPNTVPSAEVDLNAVASPEDRATIEQFLAGHLRQAWEAPEAARTRSATFRPDSPVAGLLHELNEDPARFYDISCRLARRLLEFSGGPNISPGLLLVLWFRAEGGTHYLALFKMEPGRADKVTLQRRAGQLLLELAVQHVEEALPDPGDRVLKWALLPNPTRPRYDVKVKDQEARWEPARYFMNFLGCQVQSPEREMAERLLNAVERYGDEHHHGEPWQERVDSALETLEEADQPVTADALSARLREPGFWPEFREAEFRAAVAASDAADAAISARTFGRLLVEYVLTGGIIIRGPRATMDALVRPVRTADGWEFRIRTPGFEKHYV